MRNQMQMLGATLGRAAVAMVVGLGLVGSASAGTVYSWQTEDGTAAYTDDRKRIPARYREQAKARSMKQLSSYKRYTESEIKTKGDHSPRLQARLDHLRGGGAVAMAAPGPDGRVTSSAFLVRMSGNRDRTTSQLQVPLDGSASEPIIIDNVRVRPDWKIGENGGMATRHITVVRQGDRVISVSRPQYNQRSLGSPREGDVFE